MSTTVSYIQFQPLRTLGHAAISTSYAAVGTPFDVPLRMFRITNNSNGDLIFSTDDLVAEGQLFVPADSFVLYDVAANSGPEFAGVLKRVRKGTQFYVKFLSDPSSGDVYIEGLA